MTDADRERVNNLYDLGDQYAYLDGYEVTYKRRLIRIRRGNRNVLVRLTSNNKIVVRKDDYYRSWIYKTWRGAYRRVATELATLTERVAAKAGTV